MPNPVGYYARKSEVRIVVGFLEKAIRKAGKLWEPNGMGPGEIEFWRRQSIDIGNIIMYIKNKYR